MRTLATFLALAVVTGATVNPAWAQSPPGPRASGTPHKVLQMNLCLSGMADCYPRTDYPSIVDEAATEIVTHDPEVVTLNEACSEDAADVARRTDYQMRFTAVLHNGAPVPCIKPGGRGVFGLAVLTKQSIAVAHDQPFAIQAGAEERRWICATTVRDSTVCTAHLSTRGSPRARRANNAQCRELRGVLGRFNRAGTTVFGGDLNRQQPCGPAPMWTRRDTAAAQAAGIQHIYGSMTLDKPSSHVATATFTDHDFFLTAGRGHPTHGPRARPPGAGHAAGTR